MQSTKIPIIVGITGHRDLVDCSTIYQQTRAFIAHLMQSFPHTPICVLSALAEGADQCCAEAALDCGAEHWTVIPFCEAEYCKKFCDDSGRDKYFALKSKSSRVIEINEDPASPRKYEAAGCYIAEHSTILLAVWNGRKVDRPGGTWAVIDYALNRHRYIFSIQPANKPKLPLLHIFAERKNTTGDFLLDSEAGNGDIFWGSDLAKMQKISNFADSDFIQKTFLPLEHFNLQPDASKRKKVNVPEHIEKEYDLPLWIERYSKSSMLAQQFQNKYSKQLNILFFGGVLGGVCVQTYGGIDLMIYPWANYFLIFYILLWAGMYCYWLVSHKLFHIKYLEQRLMTQQIKTYMYLKLSGGAETYWKNLIAQNDTDDILINSSLKYWDTLSEKDLEMTEETKSLIQKIWVRDQISYLTKKIAKEKKWAVKKRKIQLILTGLAILFPLYFTADFCFHFPGEFFEFLRTICGGIVAFPLFSLAMFLFYYEQQNIEKTRKQYNDMLENYTYMDECFSEDSPDKLQEKIICLGKASLEETKSWLEIYTDSHPEVIKS